MALVDSCDEPSDDVEWTAYRQVLKGYPELKAKEFRAEIDSLISLGHLALQGGESVSTSNEVEKQSLTPTPNGRAFAENTKKYRIDEALSGIAYGFVMLGEALRRVHILLHGHEDRSKCPKLDVATTTMPEREMVHTDQRPTRRVETPSLRGWKGTSGDPTCQSRFRNPPLPSTAPTSSGR